MRYKKLIFTEFGWGNPHIISTEIEKENSDEFRIKGCCKINSLRGIYCRLWFGKNVYIASTFDGFSKQEKQKCRFKFLIGFSGYR